MFRNYLKIAWRNLLINKVYSIINIAGLTIGLCSCMLVATVVTDDLSYDRQWSKGNDLYRIIVVNKMGEGLYSRSSSSPVGLKTELKKDFPQVQAVTISYTTPQHFKLTNDNNGIVTTTLTADTSFLQMFDVHVTEGNPGKYIEGSNNMIITESFRKQFFPNVNPVGRIIYDVPDYGEKSSYLITGVIKDIPSNTVLRSQVILLTEGSKEVLNTEGANSYTQQFILLKPHTNVAAFANRLNSWYKNFTGGKTPASFEFQPIKDVYLHSDFAEYQSVKGSYRNIYIFSGVAILLLFISCVNFINLSTAKANERIKETGVRKVLGALRKQLMLQFITESLLVFFIAAILSTIIYQMSLRAIENFIDHRLQIALTSRLYLLLITYGGMFFISVLTGLYPALILSSFKPAATLKNGFFSAGKSIQNTIRKSLVVVQFTISIIVLIALIVVQQQVSFLNKKDIGYNKNNLLHIGFAQFNGKAQYFKNELLKQAGVVSASITNWAPAQGPGSMSTEIDDPNNPGNKLNVWFINADLDFAKTMGMHLLTGRLLNSSFGEDAMSMDSLGASAKTKEKYAAIASKQSSLLTAYTAKLLHVNQLNIPLKEAHTNPVGIIKDFNNESLKDPLQPTIIIADNTLQYGNVLIRVLPGSEGNVMNAINKLWKRVYPGRLLQLNSINDILAAQYEEERKLQQLFSFFGSLSMLLAALGIFGLIVQATHQRVKEIGIRKVLGASVQSIVSLFSVEFIKLVIIAIFLASPVAYWFMSKWLQYYAYRITISWWMPFTAGIAALLIAFITISFQTIKAAIANPAKSLRTE